MLAGLGAIAWVNWYFFVAEGTAAAVASSGAEGATPVVEIAVRGGYQPSTVRVKAGERVRLVFDRQESASCSEEIVIPAFAVRRFLPAFDRTTIELTPETPGTYEFTCGMSMLRGRLVVE